ncbi:MAG: nucleotidyltransferase [Clostridia bacterium]
MGKVLGIIAEYNPFHNGHLHHLQNSLKLTNADYTIAIITGNFTQRGSTSLIDKWSKAEIALKNGIDLVIELPLLYSISSAENFAEGAIKILSSLNVVDYLSFGAETDDIATLNVIADTLYREPKEYKNILSHELSKGLSYPKARENALLMYLQDIRRFTNVLSTPNNILGIEYLKALKKFKSPIMPVAIKRFDVGYNDTTYTENIASATAIRNIVKNNSLDILKKVVPENSFSTILENIKIGHVLPDLSTFEKQIIYNLRSMSIEEIANLPDVSEGLEYAIKNAANSCNSIVEFLSIIKSKRYTSTRLQRILLYSLLNITKKDMQISRKTIPYIRVLGFNERGRYIISEVARQNPKLEIVTSVKKYLDSCNNRNLQLLLSKDIWSTNVYTIGYEYESLNNLDYTHKMVII